MERFKKISKETISRARFAYEVGMFYFERMRAADDGGGNVMGCAYIDKIAQARRIYDHYNRKALNQIGIAVTLKKYNPYKYGQVWQMIESKKQSERDRLQGKEVNQ